MSSRGDSTNKGLGVSTNHIESVADAAQSLAHHLGKDRDRRDRIRAYHSKERDAYFAGTYDFYLEVGGVRTEEIKTLPARAAWELNQKLDRDYIAAVAAAKTVAAARLLKLSKWRHVDRSEIPDTLGEHRVAKRADIKSRPKRIPLEARPRRFK